MKQIKQAEVFSFKSNQEGRPAEGARAMADRGAAPIGMARPLNETEVETSRRRYGSNSLSTKRRRGFWRQFATNLGDPVIRILLCALGLNLIFCLSGGDWMETVGIALAVFLATLISTLSEYGSETAFARLSEACGRAECRVRRVIDGAPTVCELSPNEIVVGDIVLLGAGEMIPADGVLLSGRLAVDQSAMTGETREVEKRPGQIAEGEALTPAHPSALLRGCTIPGGGGVMQVKRVGDDTFLGRISREVQENTRESPLKLRLSRLAGQISRLGYVAAALVALIFLINAFLFDSGFDKAIILMKLTTPAYLWRQLFRALTLGLTVLVVAVPEGLPMMIAVVLSSNIKKMVRDQVLVRKPVGIEAAGSMNLLFTDKTGTLTEGKLSVGHICLGDGTSYRDLRELRRIAPLPFARLAENARLNTQAMVGQADKEEGPCALGGNATDRALLDAVLAIGRDEAWRSSGGSAGGLSTTAGTPALGNPETGLPEVEHIPFDSTRKTSSAWGRRDGHRILYVKGAPERLLPHVRTMYLADGTRAVIDRGAVTDRIRRLTVRGERVLLIAENTAETHLPDRRRVMAHDYGELTLVCLVTLADRLRREAPEAVKQLRRAGIQVVMMTGDNKDTAAAIASKCGILDGGVDGIYDSDDLALMTDGEVRDALPRMGVIARALPTDKSRLVRIAQEAELVVGMTGDGINDAPALKRADIGFAMGAGTQVAKDAGDIIILDNNLSSIAKAVLYGRTIFKSIRKFITLQLTMNLCAMGVTMIGPFLGIDTPVTVVQMLWINLIMDTLGGLAFAGEAPLASYMEEKPKRRDEPILNRYMVHQIAWSGVCTIGLCLLFLKFPAITDHFRPADDDIYLLTAFFALFIFASVFQCFNARTDRLNAMAGLSCNPAFCLIMTAVLVVQLLFVYIGGSVLRTAPLTLPELGLTSAMALTVFPIEWLRKIWWRLTGHNEGF